MKPSSSTAASSSPSLTKSNMKEYFIQKLFGSALNTSPNANAPRSIFARNLHAYARGSDLDDDPHEWEFYPDYHPQDPLPEGIVMDSPVCATPLFHSPTPPSPPHRIQRSISFDREKSTTAFWDLSKVQQTLKRRLSWIRSTVPKFDVGKTSVQLMTKSSSIDGASTPTSMRETITTSNDSFLESIAEEIDFLDLPDDAHVSFCDDAFCVYEFEPMETMDELVIRVSEGFAAHDRRPAHTKLMGFCTKALTYLNYRGSPCAEVFVLSANDISMWRRLGHFDWNACDNQEDPAVEETDGCRKERESCNSRLSNESTASEESDVADNQATNDSSIPSSGQVPVARGNLQPLVDVMNSVLSKGDVCFTLSDIDHLCKEVEYPETDSDVQEDDGWC
ncbi:hypothetical protein DYB32_000517 [Aphanomyces invadans]|uniref:Uncharacterized protein n=1 Tax=Aphanomyces invadans TaxID=157072 RepID=A0A3R7D7A0_9STRA|nr:hypothetical protein DYB32_000517 [Aphanomyces invadans]